MNSARTKHCAPPIRRGHIDRPRLVRLLTAGLDTELTLLSAPAGFGKTALLGEWLRQLDRPFAWLSLDRNDNAWPRCLAGILTSLQTLDPAFGTGLLGALESPHLPSMDHTLSALSYELATIDDSFVLVLDDFHVLIDPQVHELLAAILSNRPGGMHLVLSSRADPPWPLARLRTAGGLCEIRAGDLRFNHEEAGSLLNGTLRLGLSPEDLLTLEGRTEGWVAGLHLAALSLETTADRHSFVQAFAGSDRFVLDYLMEEVLAQQPPEVSDFLLQTCLLDRFNASLCDHVTQRSDSQELLRHLETANLFVIPLDHERQWFAYHSLMRSFLRSVQKERDPQGAGVVHSRALEWFEANGDVLDAIQHGLIAGAQEPIGRLIRSNGLVLAFQGELSTVLAWLHDSREAWPRIGPWLRVAQLWAHTFSGDEASVDEELIETRALIREGLRAFEDEPNPAKVTELQHALAHLTAIEAHLAVMAGRHAEAARDAQAAVYGLPPNDSTTRRYCYVCLGMALRQLGELSSAVEALAQADLPDAPQERVPAPVRGLATLAGIQISLGQLDEAERTARRLLALHDDHLRRCGRRLPIATFGYARLSEILLERNRLEEALHNAAESKALADHWQQLDALFESTTQLARVRDALGDASAAFALLHRLEQSVRSRSPWLHRLTLNEEARLSLAHASDPGCLDRARRWALAHPLPADGRLAFQDHALYATHARLMLHEAQNNRALAQAGLDLAESVLRLLTPTGARGLILEASLTTAMFEEMLGKPARALDRVLICLHEAEPQGYVRLFLDYGTAVIRLLARVPVSDPSHAYAQRLLQASAATSPGSTAVSVSSPQTMEEPLSERELEVLRLLATPLSCGEIADRLFVATSTVRSHTKAIYGKLGVHTRLEAIDVAHGLHLI